MITRYRCISADPPWAPADRLPGKTRGAAHNYPVMTTAEILRYQIPATTSDALLALWRLSSMQQDAIDVAAAWGFRVVAELVWVKLTKNGLPWFGMGRTVRGSHETALLAVRGSPGRLVRSRSIRSVLTAPVPTIAADDPRIGAPYLDEDGAPVKRRDGSVRVYEAGDYVHSAKPEEFYTEVLEPMVDGPYVEMFARRRRPGWDAVGNELTTP